MSNRRVAPSAGANDDRLNPRESDGRVTLEEVAGGIIMMGHYEDAQLEPNDHGNTNNNRTLPADPTTRTVNATQATTNTDPNAGSLRVRAQPTCSHCLTIGHRRTECPSLPCKYCGVIGHLGIDCPAMDPVRDQHYQAGLARRRANNRR